MAQYLLDNIVPTDTRLLPCRVRGLRARGLGFVVSVFDHVVDMILLVGLVLVLLTGFIPRRERLFMGILRYLAYLPKLVGLIMVAVDAVEALKGGSLGAEKKKAVLDAFSESWPIFQTEFKMKETFDVFAPILGVLIDLVVAVMNVVGYFKHESVK